MTSKLVSARFLGDGNGDNGEDVELYRSGDFTNVVTRNRRESELFQEGIESLVFHFIKQGYNIVETVHKISTAEESLFELTKLTTVEIINKVSDVWTSNYTRLSCHCRTS